LDLLDDDDPALGAPPRRSNAPEYSVSELSGAVKRTVEGEFPFVRVRGEVGRVSRPSSGHLYFDLKDDRAVLSAVCWKGQAQRLTARPEEGLEVVATGRLTTFPGQSRYQMIVDDVAPAGAGALMAQLEARKRKLAAEGLFDAARKRPIPFLPDVIGVVTSPSGAVIRDILHRLRDRFPRRVVVWPVAVQGGPCAPEVIAAVQGFNALAPDGAIPRPDVIIVARGGGSVEDLWGFNDEGVARAVAASSIPLISAVGHETDTTLIDYAADLRAPTPTAAAEMAVPVRVELLARVGEAGARASRAARGGVDRRRQRLGDLVRALPRADELTGAPGQRLDVLKARLPAALRGVVGRQRVRLADLRIGPGVLRRQAQAERRRLEDAARALGPALNRALREGGARLGAIDGRVERAHEARIERRRERLGAVAPRLDPLVRRVVAEAREGFEEAGLTPDLPRARVARLREALAGLDRVNESLSYRRTLERGFAVVRSEGQVVTRAEAARGAPSLDVEFADGHVALKGGPARRPKAEPVAAPPPEQGSLL
jgi:exodeoxyribonuclease VII large subunit